MTNSSLLLFCISSIALAVTPGPTMLLALSNGMAGGTRIAAFGIAGATVANALLIAAVAIGLGAVLVASETVFNIVRVIGVLYLCWLGVKLWRTKPSAVDPSALRTSEAAMSPARAFVRSASVALSNPKALLFFSAFLPQFIDLSQAQAPQYVVLGMAFVSIDAIVMFAYAAAGTRAVKLLSARGLLIINRSCAGAMFLLAAALAAFRRQ